MLGTAGHVVVPAARVCRQVPRAAAWPRASILCNIHGAAGTTVACLFAGSNEIVAFRTQHRFESCLIRSGGDHQYQCRPLAN